MVLGVGVEVVVTELFEVVELVGVVGVVLLEGVADVVVELVFHG